MNELYRQESEREIGDLPVLLWAIAGVFTIILIHGLVGYAQYRIWLQPIHGIGIPTFAKLIAPNKIIKKTSVYFCVICVHYIIVLICAYMLFTWHGYFNHPIFICQQGELSLCLFF